MLMNCDMKRQLFLTAALVCTLSTICYSIEQNDPNEVLQKRLAEISATNKGKLADVKRIETECLMLLKDNSPSAQKGRIYTAIAKAYSEKGFTSRADVRIGKAIEYCQKALGCPQDAITSCEIYSKLANSMTVGFWELPEDQFVELRREAIVVCFKGLKIALDNNAPVAVPAPPLTALHVLDSNELDRKKVMEEYQATKIERRRKWDMEYKLFFLRDALSRLCVSLYSHEPYDIEEFRGFGQEALVDHPEAIDELVNTIQDRINSK